MLDHLLFTGVAMNIHELRPGSPERLPRPPHIQTGGTTQSGATAASGSAAKESTDVQHARDAEVVQLVQKLKDAPEVRPDLVSLVKQKLASGEYNTRQSAEQTVAAILGEV